MSIKNLIPGNKSTLTKSWFKWAAGFASLIFRFPSNNLTVIGITGSQGKTDTAKLLHYLLSKSGKKTALITVDHSIIEDKKFKNGKDYLNPWDIQKMLRKACRANCQFAIIEVTSQAIDQNRLWGINFDTGVLTDINPDHHTEYHGTSAEYIRIKTELFLSLNASERKPNIPKMAIINRSIDAYEIFEDIPIDKRWTFSTRHGADFCGSDFEFDSSGTHFQLDIPNHHLKIQSRLIGNDNGLILCAAIATAVPHGVEVSTIRSLIKEYKGLLGQREIIHDGQSFSCIVDSAPNPEATKLLLERLRTVAQKKLIAVWGGRPEEHKETYHLYAKILKRYADEIVFTTGAPNAADPKVISREIRYALDMEEGEGFFEIEDRYEAIRYALYSASKGDIVVILGRGDDPVQKIGNQIIPFDDRVVAHEILLFAKEKELW